MGKVHVSAGQFINGEFRPGRGKFPTYRSGGRDFVIRGEELDESELTDEQRADPCLLIVPVAEPEAPREEPVVPEEGEEPAKMVEPEAPVVLEDEPKAKKGK